MSATLWSKFFWSDWLADHLLRRCSPAARGLWMDLMALSMQCEPMGYLADGDKEMSVAEIARNCSMRKEQVARLLAELERHGVCSRDERGLIYSRRIVREIRASWRNKANGICGGNPQLSAGNTEKSDKPQKPVAKSHEPETRSQEPETRSQEPETISSSAAKTAAPVAPIVRAAAVMGVSIDAFLKRQAWMVFADTYTTWVGQGCDPERDIWPVLAALSAKRRTLPNSPQYFRDAVLDARDRRLAEAHEPEREPVAGAQGQSPTPKFVSPEEWQSRVDVFKTVGAWSRRWGPSPAEEGCLAPNLEATIGNTEPAATEPAAPRPAAT